MNIRPIAFLVTSLMLATSACASTKSRPDYAAFAGDPVAQINYHQLYNWQRTGDRTMVVWTKPSEAYLLTLKNTCDALDGRVTIEIGGAAGVSGKIYAGTDDVVVGQLRCPIASIQPIDLARMKQAR